MNREQLIAALYTVGRIALVIGVLAVASWLLSFLTGGFVRVLEATRSTIRQVRQQVHRQLIPSIVARVERFWSRKAGEPRAPIAVELRRLADVMEHPGRKETARLEDLQRGIAKDLNVVQSLSIASRSDTGFDLEKLKAGAQRARESFWFSALLLFMALAFGATNSFLLNLYFRETLGSFRLLPYPLPDLQASHVLALLIAFMEVAAGMVLHFFETAEIDTGSVRFFRMVPWLVILALMTVETLAYALLSTRMDLPARLGLGPSSSFYPIVEYFFAFFGAVITLLLSALGYMLWTSGKNYAAGRREIAILRVVGSYAKSVELVNERIAVVNSRLEELKRLAATFKTSLVESLHEAMGTRVVGKDLAAFVRSTLTETMNGPSTAGSSPQRIVRTQSQMTADLLIHLLLLSLWAILLYLNATNILRYLASPESGTVGIISVGAAWAVAISIAAFGYLAKDAYLASRYAGVVAASVPDRTGRRLVLYLAALGFLLGAYIDAAVSVNGHLIGSSRLLNATYGLFLALALAALSLNLDAELLALNHALFLMLVGVSVALLLTYELASLVVEALLFLAGQVLKIASIPGDWLRTRRLQPIT